ncbi:MAG: DUF3137 domain-containing protein [Muribaculaceae bacterium]|nr:DUF3137 domain-containing protein [Muribaculaceae bacterium]
MDAKTKYDLMVKLSDFYVEKIKNNIGKYENLRQDVIAKETEKTGFSAASKSAECTVKNLFMPDFVKIFGNFEWSNVAFRDTAIFDFEYLRYLNVLDFQRLIFDDFIVGKHNDINLKIADAATSRLAQVIVYVLAAYFLSFMGSLLFVTGLIFFMLHFTSMLDNIGVLLLSLKFISLVLSVAVAKFFADIILSKYFCGLIVEIDMNKTFKGHTFIVEKSNTKLNLMARKNNFEVVHLEDTDFMKQFNIYSKNQIEARYILTTAFIERLKNIKQVYKAKYIRVAFKDNKVVLLVQTGRDMFKMGGAKPLQKEEFVQLSNEIISVLDIIDILKLNKKLGL